MLNILKTRYPQNYLISRPVIGSAILFTFSFLFTLLYHPLGATKSLYFSFEFTMLIYSVASSVLAGIFITALKRLPKFSKLQQWTVGKELLSIFLILLVIGFSVFLLGFVIEAPVDEGRWNVGTFMNSFKSAFLIFILPFVFFSVSNYKFLVLDFQSTTKITGKFIQENLLVIKSQLKKESLSFYPDQLVYAVADGNYVVFHLLRESREESIYIRNSISSVTEQLSTIPFFFRCHRGFIINLKMVESKKGNSSGYLLHLKHTNDTIPVSRQKIDEFEQTLESLK